MNGITIDKSTNLEPSAAWYNIVEERFVEEQGALVLIVDVVEIFTSCQLETFQRAPALVHVVYSVRFVRAAAANFRVGCLTYVGCQLA